MKRDWLPELAVTNTALAAVGMRDMTKAKDFVQRLDFPAEMLYVDENMKAYEALGMRKNMYRPQYLVELAKLAVQTGLKGDLKEVFNSGYKPYTPSGMPEVLAQVCSATQHALTTVSQSAHCSITLVAYEMLLYFRCGACLINAFAMKSQDFS
jgi:AhpC/TSA antioxidant enzyme